MVEYLDGLNLELAFHLDRKETSMPDIVDTPGMPNVFLHGGPGLCCLAEREHYGTTLPIHW
jgi:hypothetical protein